MTTFQEAYDLLAVHDRYTHRPRGYTCRKSVASVPTEPHRRGNQKGWMDRRRERLRLDAEAVAQADVVEILPGAAPFTGGACAGRWATFDPPRPREPRKAILSRWRTAEAICATCPVLTACATWFDGIPEDQRPGGIVAGVARSPLPGRAAKGTVCQ